MTDHPPAPAEPSAPPPPGGSPHIGGARATDRLAEVGALWQAAAGGAVPSLAQADALQWGPWLAHLALAEPCARDGLVWRYACPVAAALLGTPLPPGTRLGAVGVTAEEELAEIVRQAVAAGRPVTRRLSGKDGRPLAASALPVLVGGGTGALVVVLRAPFTPVAG